MPTTLKLKNVPYPRRRNLDREVVACLDAISHPNKMSVKERLARARLLRQALSTETFADADIAQLREEGRP